MADSELQERYFINDKAYNCPFCDLNSVSYKITGADFFNLSLDEICYVYFIKCDNCQKKSLHFSKELLSALTYSDPGRRFIKPGTKGISDDTEFTIYSEDILDEKFFYSVPTSFFTLDKNIPRILRELFGESEGCLKANFLTGSSACARKLIYELAVLQKAEGDNYDDKIKSLKAKFPHIHGDYFDSLLSIQQITSDKVHEESYEKWDSKHLRLILTILRQILNEIYVIPEKIKQERTKILKLKEEVLDKKTKLESGT